MESSRLLACKIIVMCTEQIQVSLLLSIYPKAAAFFQQCEITAVCNKSRILPQLYTFIGAFREVLYYLLILDAVAKLLREQGSIRCILLIHDLTDNCHIWRDWKHIVEAKRTDDLSVICNDQKVVRLFLLIRCNRDVILHIAHVQHNATQKFLFTLLTVLHVWNTAESTLRKFSVF